MQQDQHEDKSWRYRALHDSLTDRPNRELFEDRLQQALNQRRDDRQGVVGFLDLDNFKKLNDRFGHSFGDRVLKATGRRAKEVLRPADTVARYGGDEFMALATDIDDRRTAARLGKRLYEAIASPLTVRKRTVKPDLSIGLTMIQPDDNRAERVYRRADRAMYKAKDSEHDLFFVLQSDKSTRREADPPTSDGDEKSTAEESRDRAR